MIEMSIESLHETNKQTDKHDIGMYMEKLAEGKTR